MYSHYKNQISNLKNENRTLKRVLIAGAVVVGVLGLVMWGKYDDARHDLYAQTHNCEWHYLANGGEVCK